MSDLKRWKMVTVARALGIRPGLPTPYTGPMIVDVLLSDSATDHLKRWEAAFERQAQCLDVVAQHAPGIRIVGPIECFDDDELTGAAVAQCLAEQPLAGLYDTASGSLDIQAALNHADAKPV